MYVHKRDPMLDYYDRQLFSTILIQLKGLNKNCGRNQRRLKLRLPTKAKSSPIQQVLIATNRKLLFYSKQGFPNVVGRVVGTRINIKPPTSTYEYISHGSMHTDVKVVCDSQYGELK